jgi:hypothetical protein
VLEPRSGPIPALAAIVTPRPAPGLTVLGLRGCRLPCTSRGRRFTQAHRVDVTAVAAASARADADYASAFEVRATDGDVRSPEQWARAVFEGAPRPLRWFVLLGWRGVLGLRLGPQASPKHVLGWRIVAGTSDEALTLEAHSALMTARKTLLVDGSRVVLATFIHYERRWGRPLWSIVAPIHHRTEPYLLAHAASRLASTPS